MSTTHSDPTPPAGPVEWRAAPAITTDHVAIDQAAPYSSEAPTAPGAAPGRRRGTITAGVAALLIAVGGTTGYLVSHASSGTSGTAATAQQGAPGGAGTAGGTGGMDFQPTQYHLDGTITALDTSTVTIRTTGGTTTTYTVTSGTHLVDNGATVPLSSFTVGETVRGSTTMQGGTTLNDLVAGDVGGGARAGTAPQGTPPQGTPPQGTTGTGNTGTGTTGTGTSGGS